MDRSNSEVVQGSLVRLPYVDTLHYDGCGCPTPKNVGHRAADVVDVLLQSSYSGYRSQWEPVRPLKVAYMLPHHNVTGL